MEDAMVAATQPHDLKLLIAAEGNRATSMDDVARIQDGPRRTG